MRTLVFAVALVTPAAISACGGAREDRCARAVARLARISEARAMPVPPSNVQDEMVAQCRAGDGPREDPVLRCALDAADDAAAAACIDAFVGRVFRPSRRDGEARGLNPLLGR